MARKARQNDLIDDRVAQAAKEFAEICELGRTANRKLYEALERLFVFVKERLDANDIEVLRQLIQGKELQGKELRWGSKAEQNPFHPFVTMAFPGQGEASLSQYRKILKYGLTALPRGTKFADWLEREGLDKVYEAAGQEAPSASDQEVRLHHLRLNSAREKLDKKSLASPMALAEPVELGDGYVTALVRIERNGNQVVLVDWLDADQSQVDKALLRFADPHITEMDVLRSKDFFSVFVGVDVCNSLVPSKKDDDRAIVIEQQLTACRVYVASKIYNAPFVSIDTTNEDCNWLPKGLYVLGRPDVKTFLSRFEHDGEWKLDTENQNVRLVRTSTDEAEVSFGTKLPTGLYVGKENLVPKANCDFSLERAIAFADWFKKQRSKWREQERQQAQPRDFPVALELALEGSTVYAVPVVGDVRTPLFVLDQDVTWNERWLHGEELSRLCKLMERYQVGATGHLVDTDTRDAAVALDLVFAGFKASCLMPLLVSEEGARASVAELLEAEPAE